MIVFVNLSHLLWCCWLYYHRGIQLDDGTIGIAYLGSMCDIPYSLGVTQDGGELLASVINVATHEMGHNFNMEHDTGGLLSLSSGPYLEGIQGAQLPPEIWLTAKFRAKKLAKTGS